MPLVAHSNLPTFGQLRDQGHEVLSLDRAVHQDIRELHIGFLNMMPDAALRATERQFIRLVGSCNRIAQFFVYPFSLPALERSDNTLDYIERYYSDFDSLRDVGLDALIITGALCHRRHQTRHDAALIFNASTSHLARFFDPLALRLGGLTVHRALVHGYLSRSCKP